MWLSHFQLRFKVYLERWYKCFKTFLFSLVYDYISSCFDLIILNPSISGCRWTARCWSMYTLKSYQLLHETQLPQTECAMLRVTMNGRMCRPSKLSDKCMAAWHVDHPGVTNRSWGPTAGKLYCQHLVVTELPWQSLGRLSWCNK